MLDDSNLMIKQTQTILAANIWYEVLFYFDIPQTETFTISTELLKLCYLLILFLPTDNSIRQGLF